MSLKYFVQPIDTIKQVGTEYQVVRSYGVYYTDKVPVAYPNLLDDDEDDFEEVDILAKEVATEKLALSYASLRNLHPGMAAK